MSRPRNRAARIATRWAIGLAISTVVSWPVLIGLGLAAVLVIVLSTANGPAATAAQTMASSNYSCTIGTGPAVAAPAVPAGGSLEAVTPDSAPAGDFAGQTLSAEQMKIAGTITAVAKQMKVTRRGAEVALAVAMQESALNPDAVNGPFVNHPPRPVACTPSTTAPTRPAPPGCSWIN